MANDFGPGEGYTVTLTYSKADGSPGSLDMTDPFEVVLSTPGIAAVQIGTFDTTTGKLQIDIDHNGGVGSFTASLDVDGDLAPGDNNKFPIHWSDDFNALAPMGATGVTAEVSKRPTPVTARRRP